MSTRTRYVRRETSAGPRHTHRKPPRPRHPLRTAATLAAVALASACVLGGAMLTLSRSGAVVTTARDQPEANASPVRAARTGGTDAAPAIPGMSGRASLTEAERRACPAAATACVDLKAHLTWLQSGGRVAYGPVRMEPGEPGTPNATPRGAFHVQWKAGPGFVSSEYGDPMPWATFFAPGGVAFHGGSLTHPSHGCVHLTVANARYFQDHLPIGAEVAVF